MATPWAVGIAALLLSAVKHKKVSTVLNSVEDYRVALRQYAIDITDSNLKDKSFYEGFGIIDARKMHELFH